jgi:hypothetical protein
MVKTTNTQWGFFGTLKSNYGLSVKTTEELFDLAARKIAASASVTHDMAREFLDATYGRHMADEMSFHGAKNKASKSVLTKALQACVSAPWVRKTAKEMKHD